MNKNNKPILIQFKNLTKKFGNFYAVSNINMEIRQGEIVGFLGPNGAGKTTTMKMMAYLLKPTEGEIWIRYNGDLQRLTSKNRDYLLDNIGFLIEIPFFYGKMTPRDILTYFAKLRGYPKSKVKARVEEVIAMVGLSDWIDKKIGILSKGMRQKIGVISAIVHNPDIIVLDEPHVGLDPRARKEIRDFILSLKQMGKTVFLSSHILYEISEVADRVAIISQGQLIAFDTLENLEAKAKKGEIKFKLLHPLRENIYNVIQKLNKTIVPLTRIDEVSSLVKYNKDTKIFRFSFNGNPHNQHSIVKALFSNGFEVIEFFVPKTGLLEKLYLDFVAQSEDIQWVSETDNGIHRALKVKQTIKEV